MPPSPLKSGFSLIELCVVIAILAVLVILGVPALSKARERSLAVACLGNLRGWGAAIAAYTADNRGELPPDQAPRDRGNPASSRISIFARLAPYGNYRFPAVNVGDYRGSILGCPAERSLSIQNTTCYALNIDLNYRVQEESGYGFVTYIRTQTLQNASQYLLMSDARGTSILYTVSKTRFESWTYGTARHDGTPNFLYADGHAAPFTGKFHGYSDANGKTAFYRNLFFANGIDPYSRARQ